MSGLRPFFPYYGSKWLAARGYPPPMYPTIVEPFAGGAGYACRYPDRRVVLVELDHRVATLWRWLIEAEPEQVLELPDCPPGVTVDDLGLLGPERWLVGFHLNRKQTVPARRRSTWLTQHPRKGWHAGIRKRIATQLPRIRHWQVFEGDYRQASQVVPGPATWFIDPPYEGRAGRAYHKPPLDYGDLSRWSRARDGQVIVCEGAGASWLPFRETWETRGLRGYSREAVYIQYRTE